MSLASIMPEVTAEAMRQQIVDVEKHPYAAELLLTILLYVKKAYQAKSTTLAVANIRSITDDRLQSQKDKNPAAKGLLDEQSKYLSESDGSYIYDGNHILSNPTRWKPLTFLDAIRTLAETELVRRGFTCELLEKTKKQNKWQIEEEHPLARYWVLQLRWV